MDQTAIEQAAATLRRRFADAQGHVPPEAVMCARAERQLLSLLARHGADEPLRQHFAEPAEDQGLSFEQTVQIIGGFAQHDQEAFMRLSFLMAVLMHEADAALKAGEYLELPEALRDGSFYTGPAYGRS